MKWRDWEIKKVEKGDKKYPKALLNIDNPPEQLYYRGNWSEEIFSNCLAIVGTRRVTRYGERVVEMLVPELVSVGLVVISGFMYGVDSKAHRVCVENGGKTIGVLGCGLDVLCPSGNSSLYDAILNSGGLMVSEYEAEVEPVGWRFPQRNRIVAGLSRAVLAVEGGEKSGTLITARLGAEQGKIVMAVPGPITSLVSKGVNRLIREGAVPVTKADEILFELGMEKEKEVLLKVGKEGSKLEKKIIEFLESEELEIDEMVRKTGVGIKELGSVLSMLELRGVIKKRLGKYGIEGKK